MNMCVSTERCEDSRATRMNVSIQHTGGVLEGGKLAMLVGTAISLDDVVICGLSCCNTLMCRVILHLS